MPAHNAKRNVFSCHSSFGQGKALIPQFLGSGCQLGWRCHPLTTGTSTDETNDLIRGAVSAQRRLRHVPRNPPSYLQHRSCKQRPCGHHGPSSNLRTLDQGATSCQPRRPTRQRLDDRLPPGTSRPRALLQSSSSSCPSAGSRSQIDRKRLRHKRRPETQPRRSSRSQPWLM